MGDREGYFIAGDALRAFASIAVLVFHADIATALAIGEAADPIHAFDVVGPSFIRLSAGLYVFFALSGYLVGGPFVRAWIRGDRWPDVRRYAGRRLRRIVPAFWIVTLALVAWFGMGGGSYADLAAMLAFNQVWDPGPLQRLMPQGWTLDIEVTFYVAVPLAAFLLQRLGAVRGTPASRRRALVAFLLVGSAASIALRAATDPSSGAGRNLAAMLWAFTPGLLCAAYEADARRALRGTGRGRAIGLGLIALAVASFALIVAGQRDDGEVVTELLLLGVGGGLVAGALVWQWTTGGTPRVFDGRVAHALGRWSYGIYLVHVGIGLEVLEHRPAWENNELMLLFVGGLMLVLSTVAAAILWWLVEEPFIERRLPRLPWQTAGVGGSASAPPAPPTEERAAAPVP